MDTVGSRFGEIPAGLPQFAVPAFRPSLILDLLSPAVTVAMLGAIESLLSAVVADRMGGDRHNPNTELVAQGVANIVSPLFGGLPATGAIARTATNIRSGARTPVAGMLHALTLLAILLYAAPLAAHVPLPVLAAILFVVARNMGEWGEIPELLKHSYHRRGGVARDVFADGAGRSHRGRRGRHGAGGAAVHPARGTHHHREPGDTGLHPGRVAAHPSGQGHSRGRGLFRIHGPFLFGATDKLQAITEDLESLPPVVILRLRNTTAIDATGLSAIADLADALRASHRTLIVCGAPAQPAALMHRAEFEGHLGAGQHLRERGPGAGPGEGRAELAGRRQADASPTEGLAPAGDSPERSRRPRMTLPTLNEVSKIEPTFTPPGSVCRATALRAAEAMQPQLRAVGIAAELARRDLGLEIGGDAVGRLGEDAVVGRVRRMQVGVQQPLRHLDLREALAQHQQLIDDPCAIFGQEPFVRHFADLRRVEAHPDGPDVRVVGPLLDERLDVAVALHLLTRDRAVHGDLVSLDVLQDAIVGGRRAPHVVLRLQAVDRHADLQVLDAAPTLRESAAPRW